VDYGHTIFNQINNNKSITKTEMFNLQHENILFQEEDALMKEWDFIEYFNNDEKKVEEKYAKIFVKKDQFTKMIYLPKSTLTMEYSINDLKKIIKQELKLSNNVNMKIYFNKNRILVTNDMVLKQILEFLNDKPMEIEITLSENNHCLLCMKSNCYHNANTERSEKKRKTTDSKPKISILEPELNILHPRDNSSPISTCAKKKKNCILLPKLEKFSESTHPTKRIFYFLNLCLFCFF